MSEEEIPVVRESDTPWVSLKLMPVVRPLVKLVDVPSVTPLDVLWLLPRERDPDLLKLDELLIPGPKLIVEDEPPEVPVDSLVPSDSVTLCDLLVPSV